MAGKKYVPSGVFLVCDKGTVVSQLRNFNFQTTVFGEGLSTVADKKLMVNFTPFGACAVCNGCPCTAPVTNWMPFAEGITVNGNELLLENSELKCASGGTIKIYLSLQAAQAALPPKKKSFWDYFSSAADTVVDFGKGFGKGLWKGLKGTVVGVWDLGVWASKHTPIYALTNPTGFQEQLAKDWETAKSLGNLAVKAGRWGYRNSSINAALNPEDFIKAQQENKEMFDALVDKASNMSAEEWGDFAGQVVFEIGTEVATAGSAAALTAVKAADKAVDAAKLANRLDDITDAAKAIDKIDDITDAAKTIDKIEDAADVGKPLKLGEVTNKVDEIGNIIPSVKNGEFTKWFNNLSPNEFDEIWENEALRNKIKARIRHPGGLHEWLMVSRTNVFKRWGKTMDEIKSLRTKIDDVIFKNPPGVHGGQGSTKAHNEILDLIDSSNSYNEFEKKLIKWANNRLEGGSKNLPEGFFNK